MSYKIINVLYVDDESKNLNAFTANFRKDFSVFTALTAKEAEIVLNQQVIHVLITDQKMPIKTGTELLTESAKKYPEQERIMMTAFKEAIEIKEAIRMGVVFRSLDKPWNHDQLKDAIKLGYEAYAWRLRRKNIMDDSNKDS